MYIIGGIIFILTFVLAFKAGMKDLSDKTIFLSIAGLASCFLVLANLLYFS